MIKVSNVSFSYTDKEFFKNVSFEVNDGEILGFLGPSGSGKTTLQKLLMGLISNFTGEILVNNISSKNADSNFYSKIGVDFEFSTLYEKLNAKENLKLFSSFYPKYNLRDIDELIEEIGLNEKKDLKVSEYSKGMRSRLNFIKCLVHNPDTLFLDEPTSGLDPVNSHQMKEMILREKSKGKSIIITTHDMHLAREICDRVVFIFNGKILLIDSPNNIMMEKGARTVKFSYYDGEIKEEECLLSQLNKNCLFNQVLKDGSLKSIHSSEPNLEDVFIELTGSHLQ